MNFVKKWGPVFLWAGVIFYLSSLRLSPPQGSIFFDVLLPNSVHFFEYALLFIFLWRASRNNFFSFLLGFLYALSDEFHQAFVPTRTPSILDLLVDGVGMFFAYLGLWKLLPILPSRLKDWVNNLLAI